MLPQADKIHRAIGRCLARQDKQIELDANLCKVEISVFIDHRTNEPVKIKCCLVSEHDVGCSQ
jgi:hypothetical protein